ncbi:MAG: tetratricopeptide repeat protein [Psychrilyobacter sp.]|uniref:tetratricopeptide repeat protein n=1 Tax=Psychrilyobacter sp. TaxID=2586924 RepID=UPI003C771B6D
MKSKKSTIKNSSEIASEIAIENADNLEKIIEPINNKITIATMDDLVYMLKQAKQESQPLPVFFLGAGVSKSGNIPLAFEIQNDILKGFSNNPRIKKMDEKDKTYSKLMDCLTPYERNDLLKKYIKEAKINVAHIYLAQLLRENYIDYILTVNFDNLMIRALALYNEFPPTYDIAILKDLTTTTISKKSVTYLHGQHHGLWLLNTQEEMKKVKEVVPNIIHSIKDRPWVFIGYSGEDLIFNHIIKLGRFDKGLYWVGYKDGIPSDKVCHELLEKEHANAALIQGYNADSFMFELSKSLGLEQPNIINKPFTMLGEILNNIVDIEDASVNKRLATVKNNVCESIKKFENEKFNLIKETIYNLKNNKKFENEKNKILEIEEKIKNLKNEELSNLLASLYFEWANLTETNYKENIKLYDKAIELDPNYQIAYYERGFSNFSLNKFEKAILDYSKAIELNPNYMEAYSLRGHSKACLKQYKEAILDYNKAIELDPNNIKTYGNRGVAKINLGEYIDAISDYNKSIELDPNYAKTYSWRGIAKANLKQYEEALLEYNKAIELDPDYTVVYNNRGLVKSNLKQYEEALLDYIKAIELDPNYTTAYNNRGIAKASLKKYEEALLDYNKAIELNPNYTIAYSNRGISKINLKKYEEAILDYSKAIELNSKYATAYGGRGVAKANLKQYKEAILDYDKEIELNPGDQRAINNRKLAANKLAANNK